VRPPTSIVTLVALATLAGAQSQPQLSARIGAGILRLGDSTAVRVQVDGAERATLMDLPVVEGLELGPVVGPSQTIQSVTVQGRRTLSRSVSWSVPVRPGALGEYEIPPFEVLADGERLRSSALHLSVVADLKGQELGWLEVVPSSETVVEGQPFTLEVRLGWDEGIAQQVNFAQLSLPWWDALPGAVDVELPEEPTGDLVQLQLNGDRRVDARVSAPIEEGGRRYLTMRLRRGLLPTRSGALELEGSMLEFGRVVERGGFLQSRLEKVENWYTAADPSTIEVVPLPEEGRPFDYGGAVGQVEARASPDVRDVVEGESIQLTVEWTGNGNLEFFAPPDPARIEAFAGFRTYGRIDEKPPGRRRVTYDLAPTSADVQEIPPLPLSTFDPERMEYVTVSTPAIPIRVRPLGGSGLEELPEEERFADDVTDVHSGPLTAGGGGAEPGLPHVVLALVAAFGIWLAARVLVRRSGDPDAPLERRRRRARRELARALARSSGPADELAALHAYLAALSREPAQAWVGRDAAGWFRANRPEALERHGESVRSLSELLARLERAAFGGSGASPGSREVLAAADSLRGGVL
jgi:hypothetical protein